MKKTTSPPPRPKVTADSPPRPKDAADSPPRPKAAGNGSRLNGDGLDPKQLLNALSAFKRGDFSVRLPDDWVGLAGKIADTFNDVIGMDQRLAPEVGRLGQVVGKEGRISQRASLGDVSGCWEDAIGSVNGLIADL